MTATASRTRRAGPGRRPTTATTATCWPTWKPCTRAWPAPMRRAARPSGKNSAASRTPCARASSAAPISAKTWPPRGPASVAWRTPCAPSSITGRRTARPTARCPCARWRTWRNWKYARARPCAAWMRAPALKCRPRRIWRRDGSCCRTGNSISTCWWRWRRRRSAWPCWAATGPCRPASPARPGKRACRRCAP
ncbi:hypothetical protein JaAD80_27690 [Janthinobacterium sp. AD80]|nr:hypothetical protein JaAD80_27690 [Janthinobacterium sp. AD80]